MSDFYQTLQESKDRQLFIEFKGEEIGEGTTLGIVIDFSDDFVLIHNFDKNFYFNGFLLLRTSCIANYRNYEKDNFLALAVEKLAINPPQINFDIDLLSVQAFLDNIKYFFPLISITEISNLNVISIGKIESVEEENVTLLELDANAEWFDKATPIQYEDIISIDFGGGYEKALWVVGKEELNDSKK